MDWPPPGSLGGFADTALGAPLSRNSKRPSGIDALDYEPCRAIENDRI
jgi:hypothetical protein